MRLVKREVTVKDIHTINMNVTEGQLKISRYNGDILDINGKLGFWTKNIKTYSKDSIAFVEIKPRIFKPKFLKTMPSEIELKIPKECKMNLNLYLGKVDLEISDLKLNILSIKAEESKINLINVKKETFNEEIGKSKIVIEEFERYEEIDNLGIIELETGLSFAGNDLNDFYIDIEEFSSNKKKMKKLGYGENTNSKDIIINNYF
ncbi:MAG: hypothetical protein ACRDD2_09950 [Sarcina sp.]